MHTTSSDHKRANGTKEWERLQLNRLIWALILLFAVFLGKQIYPENIVLAGERVVSVLSRSLDLETMFTEVGEAMNGGEGVLSGLENFCIEVFGAQNETVRAKLSSVTPPSLPVMHSGLLREELNKTKMQTDLELEISETTVEENREEEAVAVGTVLTVQEENGQNYPDGYTANELSFGQLKTMTPVLGKLNSGFGYREHPIIGTHSFHGGADISANTGDPIRAFSDGVVEYVGEDESYGLYLQLDHGNEIKSFYAHCQSICVKKGEYVEMGQTVATVGETGRATGPHLHLELKCCGIRVNPSYYVEFL